MKHNDQPWSFLGLRWLLNAIYTNIYPIPSKNLKRKDLHFAFQRAYLKFKPDFLSQNYSKCNGAKPASYLICNILNPSIQMITGAILP